MAALDPTSAADGRRLRSERNRDAVVEAILELLREGNDRPGAAEIALRAGVSLRSVFRHFADLESLTEAAIERHVERIGPFFALELEVSRPGRPPLALPVRIALLAKQRARLYEEMAPVRAVAERMRRRSTAVAAALGLGRQVLRRQLRDLFADELGPLGRPEGRSRLEALEMVTSFASWHQLRCEQRLSVTQATNTLDAATRAVLGDAR